MALGLISFAIGLFGNNFEWVNNEFLIVYLISGNVPCPIIYGAVVDSACLFWEYNCGKQGACRVYDPIKFRQVFHGMTALIMLAAFIVDIIVCYKAKSIQFHDEDNDNDNVQNELTVNLTGPTNPEFESVLWYNTMYNVVIRID